MPRRNEPLSRMCAVTREVRPVAELLRFVAGPDGGIVLDLKHNLPGRGVWVSARSDIVAQAAKKNVFARALKSAVRPEKDLAANTAQQLRQGLLGALSLARKSGALVAGFDQVDAAIRSGNVAALIHAAEAADDGIGKLQGAWRRGGEASPPPTVRRLTEEELSLALGKPHVIHAALLAGRASRHALERIQQVARFHDEPKHDDI